MKKIILPIFLFSLVVLNGCSSNNYLECNSESNKKIILNIIKENQKNINFDIDLIDIYNKSIDENTGNRDCHATLKITTFDKSFKTDVDYKVIKLLNSSSTHKVIVQRYNQTIGNIFYTKIKPYFIARKKGFHSIKEYNLHLRKEQIKKTIAQKMALKTSIEKEREKGVFQNHNFYLVQNDKYPLELQTIKHNAKHLILRIKNISNAIINIGNLDFFTTIYDLNYNKIEYKEEIVACSDFQIYNENDKLKPGQTKTILFSDYLPKYLSNKLNSNTNSYNFLFSIRCLKDNGFYRSYVDYDTQKKYRKYKYNILRYSLNNLTKITKEIDNLQKSLNSLK